MTKSLLPSSPHWHRGDSVHAQMRLVLLALIPGIAVSVLYFGIGVLLNIAIVAFSAATAELLALRLQGKRPVPALSDLSAIVTGVLLALTMPPSCPWWVLVCASLVAVMIGKHIFGGLGNNIFNPAMVGYAFAALAFPVAMSGWQLSNIDGVSGATPLTAIAADLRLMHMLSEMNAPALFGWLGARGWDNINLAFAFGGIFLLWRRVISWQIPVAFIAAVFLLSSILYIVDSDRYLSPMFQLFSGASMIGAFFIATDPVSSPVTIRGRLIFGAGCGLLTLFIRSFASFPDGVAFAVLTMNTAVPLIDRLTRPRTLGQAP